MAEKKTVKCRIGLAVDASGAWCAGGCAGKGGEHYSDGFDYILDGLDTGEDHYIIEVEVELPATKVVHGKAERVEATDG